MRSPTLMVIVSSRRSNVRPETFPCSVAGGYHPYDALRRLGDARHLAKSPFSARGSS